MDAINMAVLAELQEYAQLYFSAIVGLHTVDGRCGLKPGKYTAKELADSNKAACGLYVLPQDPMFDEQITITAGTFNCEFPYRRIFAILAQWEAMSKAGKLKTVFEIGETETKSAKVLIQEKTALGAFKFKTMKLQRIAGNWWRPTKLPKYGQVWLYHETNGVMHIGGRQVFASELEDRPERIEAFCEKWNDEEFIKLMSKYNPGEDSEFNGYYTKVLELAGISVEATPQQTVTPTETPQISTEAAETVNVSVEGENAAETQETPRYECPNYADYAFERGWSIENTDFDPHSGVLCMIHFDPSDEKYVCGCLWQINSDKPNYTEHRRFKTLKGAQNYGTKRMGMKLKYQTLTVNCSVTPSVPSQLPEIPQETAEPTNVSAEEGNEAIKHISEIMETCRTWDNEKRDYTDEYKYYTWLANHIPEHEATNKNTTELILEKVRERIATAATLVAHGVPKCDMEGAVCAVVNRLAKMEDILRFYDAIEPPQSPTTSTDIQTIKPQENRVQAARKEPKRTIQIFLIVQRPQSVVRNLRTSPSYHFADVRKMVVPRLVRNVPRGCFTAVMPHGSPPIRGDCAIINFLTKQSTRYG